MKSPFRKIVRKGERYSVGIEMFLKPKAAVKIARDWLAEMYADEGIADIGLEEIKWNNGEWDITLGFTRQGHAPEQDDGNTLLGALAVLQRRPRVYKVITVSDLNQSVLSMRNREST